MKLRLIAAGAVASCVGLLLLTAWAAQPKPYSAHERVDPLAGIVYFKHPTTGRLALYISFELRPDREYSVQVTDDGVTWSEAWHKSTKGARYDEYYSFNVPDPCVGLWPRVLDLGPSPP